MLVVDCNTNEIVTFAEFQKLLKGRYAKEYLETTERQPGVLTDTRKQTKKRSANNITESEPTTKKAKPNFLMPTVRQTRPQTAKSLNEKVNLPSRRPRSK